MIAVIFEVVPEQGKFDEYMSIAGALKVELEKIDGFISVERFESVSQKGKYVSISFWQNEEAVRTWRTQEAHRMAQLKGRKEIFADYRLRIAEVVRDYTLRDRGEAPPDSVTSKKTH